ncbi:MAG: DUF4956 domain-containing protein [Defluviitaleaceae bacterium]|nr:DUF4956 domain-containing protein [Defluviitaleaceae bacterium]
MTNVSLLQAMNRTGFLERLLQNPDMEIVSRIEPIDIVLVLLVSSICSFVIFLTYRYFNRSVLYSENFNLLILMLAVVTSFIIITVGTNVVLALGMVGGLSIVRFRAAVKDPLDVGFLFWSVAVGITAGARLYIVSIVCTIFIAALYILFTILKFDKKAYLMIIRHGNDAEEAVNAHLAKIKYKLKNKTVGAGFTELTLELKAKNNDTSFIEPLKQIRYVDNVVMVEYTGDYA